MSEKNNGGPAFPHQDNRDTRYSNGMSLRDYFAAKALSGQLASFSNAAVLDALGLKDHPELFSAWCATSAYKIADAMLAKRDTQSLEQDGK